ncbi:hypothetical protein BGW39_002343 [Mortierella sp. 14UC]|nr:hypothetical protein BGW39_002343 [Mortierella sp. 14UC]
MFERYSTAPPIHLRVLTLPGINPLSFPPDPIYYFNNKQTGSGTICVAYGNSSKRGQIIALETPSASGIISATYNPGWRFRAISELQVGDCIEVEGLSRLVEVRDGPLPNGCRMVLKVDKPWTYVGNFSAEEVEEGKAGGFGEVEGEVSDTDSNIEDESKDLRRPQQELREAQKDNNFSSGTGSSKDDKYNATDDTDSSDDEESRRQRLRQQQSRQPHDNINSQTGEKRRRFNWITVESDDSNSEVESLAGNLYATRTDWTGSGHHHCEKSPRLTYLTKASRAVVFGVSTNNIYISGGSSVEGASPRHMRRKRHQQSLSDDETEDSEDEEEESSEDEEEQIESEGTHSSAHEIKFEDDKSSDDESNYGDSGDGDSDDGDSDCSVAVSTSYDHTRKSGSDRDDSEAGVTVSNTNNDKRKSDSNSNDSGYWNGGGEDPSS